MNKNIYFYIVESILAFLLLISAYMAIGRGELFFISILGLMVIFNLVWLISAIISKKHLLMPIIELVLIVALFVSTIFISEMGDAGLLTTVILYLAHFLWVLIYSTIKINVMVKKK